MLLPLRPRPFSRAATSALLASGGIFIMVLLAGAAHMPIAAVPFATSIVLVAGSPESPPARLKAILGGHLICALCGLATLKLGFSGSLAMSAAVGLSVGAMLATGAFHPPAGITPLVILTLSPGWDFLISPVIIGALLVVALAWLAGVLLREEK